MHSKMAIKRNIFIFALLLGVLCASVEGAGKCKVCDDTSSTDEKCAKDVASVTEQCDAAEKCFTAVANNGRVKRGCVTDNFKCDGDDCTACTASDTACNTKTVFSCRKCDATDPNCAQWYNADAIKSELCKEGITKCLMKITDKKIERRCATTNDEACSDSKTCQTCQTSGCNKDVFPTNRRRCYQCAASSSCANPTASETEAKSLPCQLYDEADECVMYAKSDTEMGRGCSSDADVKTACDGAKEKCKKCTTDNCNYKSLTYTQELKCIQCSSTSPDCAWGYDKSKATNCPTQIPFYQTEGCYTNKAADGKTDRGCIHDTGAPDCTTANGTCQSCASEDGCNNADTMDFTCYTCRSDLNPACAKPLDKDSFKAQKCREPVTSSTKGCYVEKYKDLYIRSCLVDADVTTRKQCEDDKYKMCDSCYEKNCNSDKLKNSAAAKVAGVFLLIAGLMAVTFM